MLNVMIVIVFYCVPNQIVIPLVPHYDLQVRIQRTTTVIKGIIFFFIFVSSLIVAGKPLIIEK